MKISGSSRLPQRCAMAMLLALLSSCSALLPKPTPQPAFFTLDGVPNSRPVAQTTAQRNTNAPTLVVNPPRAAAGFDSQRIIYVRQPHKLEYFARSQWIDTPARMLAPLIVAAVERSGKFEAVLQSASGANGDIRLDTEILRLEHDFASAPSQVRFTLRVYLVDTASRRVLAWKDIEGAAPAASEDPYGGVVAANVAVQSVLDQLATFCRDAANDWHPSPTDLR